MREGRVGEIDVAHHALGLDRAAGGIDGEHVIEAVHADLVAGEGRAADLVAYVRADEKARESGPEFYERTAAVTFGGARAARAVAGDIPVSGFSLSDLLDLAGGAIVASEAFATLRVGSSPLQDLTSASRSTATLSFCRASTAWAESRGMYPPRSL